MGTALCPYCKRRPKLKNKRGRPSITCGMAECKRAYDAERKREWRARKAGGMVEEILPAASLYDAIETPFGDFPTHLDAWIHVLSNEHNFDVAYTKRGGHRDWAEESLASLSVLSGEEYLNAMLGIEEDSEGE